jgi:hypothetical protein
VEEMHRCKMNYLCKYLILIARNWIYVVIHVYKCTIIQKISLQCICMQCWVMTYRVQLVIGKTCYCNVFVQFDVEPIILNFH